MELVELIRKYKPVAITIVTDINEDGKYYTRASLAKGGVPTGEAHFLARNSDSYEESFDKLLEQINKIPS